MMKRSNFNISVFANGDEAQEHINNAVRHGRVFKMGSINSGDWTFAYVTPSRQSAAMMVDALHSTPDGCSLGWAPSVTPVIGASGTKMWLVEFASADLMDVYVQAREEFLLRQHQQALGRMIIDL